MARRRGSRTHRAQPAVLGLYAPLCRDLPGRPQGGLAASARAGHWPCSAARAASAPAARAGLLFPPGGAAAHVVTGHSRSLGVTNSPQAPLLPDSSLPGCGPGAPAACPQLPAPGTQPSHRGQGHARRNGDLTSIPAVQTALVALARPRSLWGPERTLGEGVGDSWEGPLTGWESRGAHGPLFGFGEPLKTLEVWFLVLLGGGPTWR